MTRKQQAGFSLIETMVSLIVLLAVSAIVMTGMSEMMHTQGTMANRTEMHTSVRGATELLEQEIGQAGKISLPPPVGTGTWLMLTPIALFQPDTPVTTTVVFSAGLTTLFDNEQLLVDTGPTQETITITCGPPAAPTPGACTNTWTAGPFYYNHLLGNVPISAPGAFATGIVPPAAGVMANPPTGYAGFPNGSTGTVLKLYGDINGDGNMLYVEYTCVTNADLSPGFLYRNEVAFNAAAAAKNWSPPIPSTALLSNVLPNPKDLSGNAVPCFNYQVSPVGIIPDYTTLTPLQKTNVKEVYVTDVAVTLTEQTQNVDPQTNLYQKETKALLNVSPRNVFNAYLLARGDETNRVQPMPLILYNNLLP